MKCRRFRVLCFLGVLCVVCGSALPGFTLDRESFTFTSYDLAVQIEPDQHRLGVRGKITLRNDSSAPQKDAVLQISSSLDWRSIKLIDNGQSKPVQFLTQPYASDIDHTGALSEAIVTLPQPVAPKGTVDLEIGYEGVIVLDATRLTRIGTPEDTATNSDWDQISTDFTAVRGAGYVAWYPVATESANLSEGSNMFEALGRWKTREADSQMSVLFESTRKSPILFSGTPNLFAVTPEEGMVKVCAFSMIRPGWNVPTFVQADYTKVDVKGASAIEYLPGKEGAALSYAEVLGTLDPLSSAQGPAGIQVAQSADPDAAPFASQGLLLIPFKPAASNGDRMTLVYALARQKAVSPQPWISEGLAHLAQVLDVEHQYGRKAALEYLNSHQSMIVQSEKPASRETEHSPSSHALTNAADEVYLQSKAMYTWSMLRDMVGDVVISSVLFSYHAMDDKDPAYMQTLFARHTQRDLQWFFDDWVYHDRGLPDFKVESVFPLKRAMESYLVTVTVDNLGTAGAEVPVMVKFPGGEVSKRVEVRAKSKGVIRVEVPKPPLEVTVNDGSVPESDVTNNTFSVQPTQPPK